MDHCISLAAGVVPDAGPLDMVRIAAESGYSWVGATIPPENWTRHDRRAFVRAVDDSGLDVLDVEVVRIPPGGAIAAGNRAILETAVAVGARNVLVVSDEPDPACTAESLYRMCEAVRGTPVRIALEFMRFTCVKRLSDAVHIVDRIDHEAIGILIDTLHWQRAGEPIENAASIDPACFPYVQLCDGLLDCADDHATLIHDALDLRSAPGDGELPLREMLAALPSVPYSLEVRSRHYRETYPDPVARGRAIRQATESFLDSLTATQ